MRKYKLHWRDTERKECKTEFTGELLDTADEEMNIKGKNGMYRYYVAWAIYRTKGGTLVSHYGIRPVGGEWDGGIATHSSMNDLLEYLHQVCVSRRTINPRKGPLAALRARLLASTFQHSTTTTTTPTEENGSDQTGTDGPD